MEHLTCSFTTHSFPALLQHVPFLLFTLSCSGHADGAGDADSAASGRGRDYVPDSSPAAPERHTTHTNAEHGQHLQLPPDHPAAACR